MALGVVGEQSPEVPVVAVLGEGELLLQGRPPEVGTEVAYPGVVLGVEGLHQKGEVGPGAPQ